MLIAGLLIEENVASGSLCIPRTLNTGISLYLGLAIELGA